MITFSKLGKYGRFGNQLFHIASTIGIAARFGYTFGFPEWKERKHFKNELPFCGRVFPEYKLRSERGLLIEYKYFDCLDRVSLLGHMFSEKYFLNCEKTIRHYFEMKEISGLPKIEENSIAIHVRAGDFGTKQFPRMTKEYYERALDRLPKDCTIYVFSDEIGEAAGVLADGINEDGFYYSTQYDYIKDFYLMQKCKHFIIANSTFSWWAAWLGKHPDKIIIAPKNMETAMYTDEMYPNQWIVI